MTIIYEINPKIPEHVKVSNEEVNLLLTKLQQRVSDMCIVLLVI